MDHAEAFEWVQHAVEARNPLAMTLLCVMYAKGKVSKSLSRNQENVTRSCKLGGMLTLASTSDLYSNGDNVWSRDEENALHYYTLAYCKNSNYGNAGARLGYFFQNGTGGTNKSLYTAKKLQMLAKKKHILNNHKGHSLSSTGE